jgi:hemin uptake protein HemP
MPENVEPIPNQGPFDASSETAAQTNSKVVRSTDLFEGRRELLIVHEGEAYRLRITRNNKLILQK